VEERQIGGETMREWGTKVHEGECKRGEGRARESEREKKIEGE
jgi:hypothetical protein